MITEIAVKEKDGDTFTHSGKNVTKFGSHFDGERFYFFESDDEKILFFNPETTEKQLRQITKEKNNDMQTHENTNVVKPTMIGKKPVFKSKKYKLNILDYAKGFTVACLSSALFVVQQLADGGTLGDLNYKPVIMAAISGGVGYLLKNFFTDSSKK